MKARIVVLLMVAVGAMARPACATEANWNATLGVLRLLLPVGEINLERRISDQVGVGISAGMGKQSGSENRGYGPQPTTQTVTEGALFGNYYAEGFDNGMIFGAELRVFQGKADFAGATASQIVQLGGYGGYKFTHFVSPRLGLVGALHLGYKFALYPAEVATENNPTASITAQTLVNLLLGVAF